MHAVGKSARTIRVRLLFEKGVGLARYPVRCTCIQRLPETCSSLRYGKRVDDVVELENEGRAAYLEVEMIG